MFTYYLTLPTPTAQQFLLMVKLICLLLSNSFSCYNCSPFVFPASHIIRFPISQHCTSSSSFTNCQTYSSGMGGGENCIYSSEIQLHFMSVTPSSSLIDLILQHGGGGEFYSEGHNTLVHTTILQMKIMIHALISFMLWNNYIMVPI